MFQKVLIPFHATGLFLCPLSYPFKVFKFKKSWGCLPQILFSPLLNTLSYFFVEVVLKQRVTYFLYFVWPSWLYFFMTEVYDGQFRSSHQRRSIKKLPLKISQILRGIPVPATQACNFIKKETLAQVFSYEFCKIYKKTNFYRTPLVVASVYGGTLLSC